MKYTIVLLDGREIPNLTLDQIKDLYFRRKINQSSLIFSNEQPNWQMLKRVFDLSQWTPTASAQTPNVNYTNQFTPHQNPFAQNFQHPTPPVQNSFQPPAEQFGQTGNFNPPPGHSYQQNENFNAGSPNGYTQNNQSQTFYQAQTLPTENKLQNIQSNYTPKQYSYAPPQTAPNADERIGLRPAAVFLIVNVLIYGLMSFIGNFVVSPDAEKVGRNVGTLIIPIVIDLMLAVKLWNNTDTDSARRWVLARTYLGFIVFGIVMPLGMNGTSGMIGGFFLAVISFFYLLSICLVLHGKQSPSPGRVMTGIGTFAVYVFLSIGLVGLALLGSLGSRLEFGNPQMQKYKIEGTEFKDKTTGAKVSLPENWVMLSLSNPIISTPEARMIAMDKRGERLTLLEVVPVPAQLDMKRQSSSYILDQLCDGVVKAMSQKSDRAGNQSIYVKEISRIDGAVGKHPSKKLIIEKTEGYTKAKGHVTITYDELTFYVLHSWCPTEEYTEAIKDFEFFERNFDVPDKINSVFTQTAEKDQKKQ